MRTQIKNNKLVEARENANGFSFASNWSGGWCEVSGPITEHSWVKAKHSRIAFDTVSKIVHQLAYDYLVLVVDGVVKLPMVVLNIQLLLTISM